MNHPRYLPGVGYKNHLRSQIADEPATQGRLDTIVRVATRNAIQCLPEAESIVAAFAMGHNAFLLKRYGHILTAADRAAEIVPEDWRRLALQDFHAKGTRGTSAAIPRRTHPRLDKDEPFIIAGRRYEGFSVRFHDVPVQITIERRVQIQRGDGAEAWLYAGAIAGHLGLGPFQGRRFIETNNNTQTEVFEDTTRPFLELGRWLGLRPDADYAINDPNDPELSRWKGFGNDTEAKG